MKIPEQHKPIAQFALGCTALMWTLPWLEWHSLKPLAFFYSERDAFAISLGALALLLLPQSWAQQSLPRITLLPAALVVLVLIQLLFGRLSYPCQALTYSLYLIWALLLMHLGRQLREMLGLTVIMAWLCWALLGGAEISAMIAGIQYYNGHGFFDPIILQTENTAAIGNMGQRNHLATYLSMGLVMLACLHARGAVRLWQAALLAAPLLFAMTLTSSRSTWLYLACFALLTCIWRKKSHDMFSMFRFALVCLALFSLMHGVVYMGVFAPATLPDAMTPLERMGDIAGYRTRLHLWHVAWQVFLEYPLIGAGFGQFGWQNFLLGPALENPLPGLIASHAHNLIMQLAAESGLVGVLITVGALGIWVAAQRGQEIEPNRAALCIMLAMMGIHAMLEYPLWYAYFLAIAALSLGMLDSQSIRFNIRRIAPALMMLILLLGGLILWRTDHSYSDLAELYLKPPASLTQDASDKRINSLMNHLEQENMLRHYAHVYAMSVMKFDISDPELRLLLSERAVHVAPTQELVYRLSVLQAVNGNESEAKATMRRAIWAYPDRYDQVVRYALPWLELQAPVQLKPLKQFADLIYAQRLIRIGAQ